MNDTTTDVRWSSGALWLAACAPYPTRALHAWAAGLVAGIAPGTHWWVAETPLYRGLVALHQLATMGPVLAHVGMQRAWWLTPAGVGEGFGTEGLTVHTGGPFLCPPPGREVHGLGWVVPPDGSGQLTGLPTLAVACGVRWLLEARPV